MLYVLLVLLMSNLGAMFDSVFHPETSYFDEEHLVVGGITGITTILLLGALEMYLAKRKQVEAKLNESNERLQIAERKISKSLLMLESIVSTNPDVIFSMDLNVNLTIWNRTLEVVTGLAAEALKNKPVLELFVEEDRPSVLHSVQKCLEEGEGEVEARLFNAQGGSTLFQFKGVLLKEEDGSVVGITGSGRDITERKRAEEELKTSEKRFQDIADHMQEWIWEVDAEGKYTYASHTVEKILGYTPEEILQKHFYDIFHPDDRESLKAAGLSAFAAKEPFRDFTNRNVHRNGQTVWLVTCGLPLIDEKGNLVGYRGVDTDITKHRELEAQYIQARKMEAVGTLAGGIAHDFNNALTGIIGYGELLRRKIASDEQALHDLDEILRCGERAATLTRQLLTFARRQIIEPVNLNLNPLVADLMKLIGKVVGEHIEVKTSLEKNVPTIHADRGQIEQVVMNLCLNARDAMPEGGRLVVETEDVYLEEEYVRQNPYMKTGRYALLTVSDTGIGMDENTRARAFDPFFTTKGPDKGTGLGLAMVYGIVKQHGGFIHLYSEPGKGTAFKVYFPAIEAQPDAVPTIRREESLRGGTETILLAEDEDAIRALIERTLKELGYTVLVARNGEEAIEIFRQEKEIVLAVLDVVMPRKGGKEAFEEMHKQNPRLKVIFMSGYSANAIHDSFVLIASTPFLQKPFGPTRLARKIREVLDTQ
jgi:PAS domain S-box-containing protein